MCLGKNPCQKIIPLLEVNMFTIASLGSSVGGTYGDRNRNHPKKSSDAENMRDISSKPRKVDSWAHYSHIIW
jgi:hypothetical protein